MECYIADSAKRVEEARQKQAQELVDIQHTTELEEMYELPAPATRSKGTMVEDEEEPVTEEEPVKEEVSVSDILPPGLCVINSETRAAGFQIPGARY